MIARVCSTFALCILSAASASAHEKTARPMKPLSVERKANRTLTVDYENATEGKFHSTMWRTAQGSTMIARHAVGPTGAMTWTRESTAKVGPIARLTGNHVPTNELHYVGQVGSSPTDAKAAAATLAKTKGAPIVLHLNNDTINFAP